MLNVAVDAITVAVQAHQIREILSSLSLASIFTAVGRVAVQIPIMLLTAQKLAAPKRTLYESIGAPTVNTTEATVERVAAEIEAFIDLSITIIVLLITAFLTIVAGGAGVLTAILRLQVQIHSTWSAFRDHTAPRPTTRDRVGQVAGSIAVSTMLWIPAEIKTLIHEAITIIVGLVTHLNTIFRNKAGIFAAVL